MSAGGEARELQPVLVHPWRKGAVGEQDIASLEQGGHGMGAGFLASVRLHGNNAGDLVLERVDNGWPVGLVLDKDAGRNAGEADAGAFRKLLHLRHGLGKAPASSKLVEDVVVGPMPADQLAHNEVAGVVPLEA